MMISFVDPHGNFSTVPIFGLSLGRGYHKRLKGECIKLEDGLV